jgi:hypothetical protein
LGSGFPTGEQRRFFEELLAYLRDELEARKHPVGVEQRAEMFGALAGEAGRAQVRKDKRLAEEGFVYLAEMESTAAVGGEYAESVGEVYVIEYGARKLITPDPGDPSAPLRARWRELKDGWPPAASPG